MTLGRMRLLVVLALFVVACSGSNTTTVGPTPPVPPTTPPPPPLPPSQTVYLVGAGDIADCGSFSADGGIRSEATAKLLDSMPEASVFAAGDLAYFDGTAAEFGNCYGPRWGRHKNRTRPAAGNHEYNPPSFGLPYYDYFGERAGTRGVGFYSYTLGNWHIVSLNSNVDMRPGSEQLRWLTNDLADNKNSDTSRCTLAYWHHPLFTSGPSAGSSGVVKNIWDVLFEYGVDVVVNGHDHLYERFRPQDPLGRATATTGITEYVVGTGGVRLYEFGATAPNSAFRNRSWGVIRFTLRDVGYDSVFVEAGTLAQIDPSVGNLCH